MQLPQPHFFTSERDVAYIDRPQMNLNEGPVAERVDGYHTIWIAEVPFIPGYASETYKDFDFASQTRLNAVLRRQRRFLSDLAQLHEHQASFELRLVSWPRHQQAAQVGIAFLGKVFNKDKRISRDQAAVLWDRFSAIFPKEIPFSYPLIPVQLDYSKAQQQSHSFFEWLLPLPLDQLTYETHPESIVEIRKYEDWPDVHGDARLTDYIPHPFKPALDYATMARLFETLALQQEICVVSAVLRPQHLTERELVVLHDLLARHRQCVSNGMTKDAIIDLFKMYMSTRAKSGVQVYERLVHEQRCLFTMRLQVLGIPAAQQDVIEALGSEVVANSSNEPSGLWSLVMPSTPQEFHSACFNARWLEFVRWGSSPLITTDARDLT